MLTDVGQRRRWWSVLLLQLLLIVPFISPSSAGGAELGTPRTCEQHRAFKMLGYDCSNMNLHDVPQKLKTSVEVSIGDGWWFRVFGCASCSNNVRDRVGRTARDALARQVRSLINPN